MKAIPLKQSTAEDNYHAPNWWINFTADIVSYHMREKTKKRLRVAAWLRDVNEKLLDYGGQLQRKKDNDYILYFRIDNNFTYFLLKYEHEVKTTTEDWY